MQSGRSWRRATELGLLPLAFTLAVGCGGRFQEGRVDAGFTVRDCPPGDDNDGLADFGFEPGFIGATRFNDDLTIQLLEYRGLVEETDGLSIQVRLADLVEAGRLVEDEATDQYRLFDGPLSLPVALDGLNARASLSMFQTCPDFPTVHAVSGTLTFDRLQVSVDPRDLGRDERLTGTLTASVSRGAPLEPVGWVTAAFDFEVPRRPLLSVR